MKHPHRIRDIATQAGLSEATVDRVLHQRGGVRESTAREVHQAIAELDRQQSRSGSVGGGFPVDVVVHAQPRFAASVRAALDGLDPVLVRPRFHGVDDPADLAPLLDRIGRSRSQGLILSAPDSPDLPEQLGRLAQPVVALGTDLPASKRAAFCGLDHTDAGATAAYLIEQWLADRAGDVLLVRGPSAGALHHNSTTPTEGRSLGQIPEYRQNVSEAPAGGMRNTRAGAREAGVGVGNTRVGARDPEEGACEAGEGEREAGFRAEIACRVPHRRVLEVGGDAVHARTRALLAANPTVRAVYSLCGGSGANAAVVDAFVAERRKYDVFVAHELDAENAELLRAHKLSAVLHHDLRADLRHACLAILRALGAAPGPVSSRTAPIRVLTPFNIP